MNSTSRKWRGSKTARDTHNPRELERDSDEIRADMDRTLEALERKFSPREVVQRSVGYVREHSAEVAQEIGETVRRNPVPVILTVGGLAWLIAAVAQNRSDANEEWTSEEHESEDDELDEEYAKEADEGVRGRVRTAADRVRTKASEAAHRVGETIQSRTSQARNSFGQFVQEQPLVVGMIALTAGALLGAALPDTEYERRALGASGGDGSSTDRERYGTPIDTDLNPTPTV